MNETLTLGSLFDGIGGFLLAGVRAGIKPVWASEIEPFPIRVTTKRFPEVRHIGDIHAIHGGEIEPVDIITFGSPCQNLSVAGNRTGLNGDQSSLFFEAIRIIREMREKTHDRYPRWAVWENVPGALHCSNGLDFREVLESLIQIKDPKTTVPMPDGKWLSAGEIRGCASALDDGYSLAWRIIDAAKGWGVAQRRRRIFAVLDLDGGSAGKILFESEGLSGYSPPHNQARQDAARTPATGAGAPSIGSAVAFEPGASRRLGGHAWEESTGTLRADMGDNQTAVAYGISSDLSNAMLSSNPHSGIYEADTSRTLDCSGGNPSCNQGGIAIVKPAPSYCMTVGGFAQVWEDKATTLEARGYKDPPVVGRPDSTTAYIARRLVPDECALLQGYPADWCHDVETDDPTEDEIDWWLEVFEVYRKAMGRSTKPRSRNQIRKWLQSPRADAAEYKAYGNSVAIPCVHFVLAGIVWAHEKEASGRRLD